MTMKLQEKYGPGSGHIEAVCSECNQPLEAKFYPHPTDLKDRIVNYECPAECKKTIIDGDKYHQRLNSYRNKLEDEKIENAVNTLSDFVNKGGDIAKFAVRMGREHRTLQQSFTKLCMVWFEYLAKQTDFDGRNEASISLAKKVVAIENKYLPLV